MIPYLSLKDITDMHGDEIQAAVQSVVSSGWYLQGDEVKAFEQEYATYIGSRHCVSCANGLDALTLILRAYKTMGKLRNGDEIIVPANTYIASILAISENNLTPILVEPDPATLQLDGSRLAAALSPRTRGVMLVHLYGCCAYTEAIGAFCKHNDILLIEDNAQAHGCQYSQDGIIRHTGSLGDAAGHSFYPGKNLGALGDAGAVTTDDAELADVIRSLANYGSSRKYVFDYQGRNSRMDEIQAAALRVKLRYLDADNARRCDIATAYNTCIKNDNIRLPYAEVPQKALSHVWHIYPVLCTERDKLADYLLDRGVQTMIHYPIPPHQQQAYAQWQQLSFPITEQIHREVLSLPCNPAMTDEQVKTIIGLLNDF